MLYWFVLMPLFGALLAWVMPSGRARPMILPVVGAAHLAMTVSLLSNTPPPSPGGWIFLREDAQIGLVHLHREEPDVPAGNVSRIGLSAIVVLELMRPVAGSRAHVPADH